MGLCSLKTFSHYWETSNTDWEEASRRTVCMLQKCTAFMCYI